MKLSLHGGGGAQRNEIAISWRDARDIEILEHERYWIGTRDGNAVWWKDARDVERLDAREILKKHQR